MKPTNPNMVFEGAKGKGSGTVAKDGLKFLEARGIIEYFDYEYTDDEPGAPIKMFLVYPMSREHRPLRMTPDEVLAFCRGARVQYRANQKEFGDER